MNYQVLRRQVFIYLFWGLLFGNVAPSYGINFSLDPASPTIDGNITPDDVLNSVPEVAIQGSSLGLQDDFFNGLFDNLDALSYGRDFIGGPLFFSVDRLAMGSVGSAVETESLLSEAAGDVYRSFPGTGSNQLLIDEEELGLTPVTPGFFGDDVDALAMEDKGNSIFTYFSIDDFSASNFLGAYSSDIILSKDGEKSFSIFANGFSDIGLEDTDDIDALALYDVINPGILDPGKDLALFSLSSFSSSLLGGFSPADILFTDFTGDFSRFASAAEIGLDVWDELDALDTVNVPEPLTILGTTTAIAFGAVFKRKQSQKTKEKDSQSI
jgi:hypothetical protein